MEGEGFMLGEPHTRRTMFLCNFVHFGGPSGVDGSLQRVNGATWQARVGVSAAGSFRRKPLIIGGKVKGVCQWCGGMC